MPKNLALGMLISTLGLAAVVVGVLMLTGDGGGLWLIVAGVVVDLVGVAIVVSGLRARRSGYQPYEG
ncbi:hypothetical protein ACI8AF_21925 [Blastococcus sp. SYSU D00669]